MAWTLCPLEIKKKIVENNFYSKGVSKSWEEVMLDSRQGDDRILAVPFPGSDVHP